MEGLRKCKKCGIEKPANEVNFAAYPNKKGVRIMRLECRECARAQCKSYKAGNRGKISDYNKGYKATHTEDTRDYNREYFRNRRQTDVVFRIKTNNRSRISGLIAKDVKAGPSLELISCTHEQFMGWIEFQLDECPESGMTIDNYGEFWHLDHVKPCASFNMIDKDEQRQCFHWTNYRPLVASENLEKHDKVDENILKAHKEVVTLFWNLVGEDNDYSLQYSIYK